MILGGRFQFSSNANKQKFHGLRSHNIKQQQQQLKSCLDHITESQVFVSSLSGDTNPFEVLSYLDDQQFFPAEFCSAVAFLTDSSVSTLRLYNTEVFFLVSISEYRNYIQKLNTAQISRIVQRIIQQIRNSHSSQKFHFINIIVWVKLTRFDKRILCSIYNLISITKA